MALVNEDKERVYVKHLISEKNSDGVIGVLKKMVFCISMKILIKD